MNCRELTELLLDFLNDELSQEFCDRIREHLAQCPPCVIYVETYQITVKLSHNLQPPPMSEGFAQRLQAMLKSHMRQMEES